MGKGKPLAPGVIPTFSGTRPLETDSGTSALTEALPLLAAPDHPPSAPEETPEEKHDTERGAGPQLGAPTEAQPRPQQRKAFRPEPQRGPGDSPQKPPLILQDQMITKETSQKPQVKSNEKTTITQKHCQKHSPLSSCRASAD